MFISNPRRSLGLAAAAATALASVALTGAAGAAPRHADATRATTIHVIEHAITDTENPGVGGPDAKGNILTFINPVFNPANTRRVGHDEGFCTRLDPKQGVWECLWTTFLKRGQITVQGPFYDTHNSVLSITGGTGAYRRARGQMRLLSRNGGKEYDFIFQLS
jgi:hypothetical protein